MMNYCTICFLPSTKPDLYFNDSGVCAACVAYKERKIVDSAQREKEFIEIVQRVRATGKRLASIKRSLSYWA